MTYTPHPPFPYQAKIRGDWMPDGDAYDALVIEHAQFGAICLVTRETLERIAADQAEVEADNHQAIRFDGDECQWIDLDGSYTDRPGEVVQHMRPLGKWSPFAGMYPAPEWCWDADAVEVAA